MSGADDQTGPLRVRLEKLRPAPGDVLLLRRITGAYDEDPLEMPVGGRYSDPLEVVQQWVVDQGLDGVLIVALADDQEFAVLDRDQMREHGWVRTDPLDPPPAEAVKAVETALASRWAQQRLSNDSDPETDAYTALEALTRAGWALVRTGSADG